MVGDGVGDTPWVLKWRGYGFGEGKAVGNADLKAVVKIYSLGAARGSPSNTTILVTHIWRSGLSSNRWTLTLQIGFKNTPEYYYLQIVQFLLSLVIGSLGFNKPAKSVFETA